MLLLAAHPSRHRVLCDCIDPSVLDEEDPDRRDPELDLYAPDNPNQSALLGRTSSSATAPRSSQRVRRITASVKDRLASLRAQGRPHDERAFVVHGTLADPRVLDPVDRPQRTRSRASRSSATRASSTTARSGSPATAACAAGCRSGASTTPTPTGCAPPPTWTVPALVVSNGADNICTPGYSTALFQALAGEDKSELRIAGANHYYIGPDQREHLRRLRRRVHGVAVRARPRARGGGSAGP